MPKRVWKRAERGFLSDEAGLVALAVIALWRGYSYLPGQVNINRSPAHWLESLMPPPSWAILWIIIGAVCVVATRFPQLMPVAVGLAVGLNVAWLVSFMWMQFSGENLRSYVSALNYFGVAFFVSWGFGRGRKVTSVFDKE